MNIKRLTLIARKKAAVAELINCSATKKFTQKQYEQTARKYLIRTRQLKMAMSNFLNFGMVDLRYRSAKANAPKRDDAVANAYSNAKNLAVLTSTFAMKPLDELRVLLHEYINSSERSGEFLYNHQINFTQWYQMLKNLYITGKIGKKMIFNFREYKKLNVKDVIRYAKYRYGRKYTISRKNGEEYNYNLPENTIFSNILMISNEEEKLQIKRAAHILQMYLV